MYSKKVCKITQSHANAVLDFTNVSILCDMKNSVKDLTIYLQNYKNYNCIFLLLDFHAAGLPKYVNLVSLLVFSFVDVQLQLTH